MALLAKLDKYHGKPKEITIKNDDGESETWKIYPLPSKYFPLMVRVQEVIKEAKNKVVDGKEVPDVETLTSEQKAQLFELNKEVTIKTIAFSMGVQEGVFNYRDFDKKMMDSEIEQIEAAVERMSMEYLQQFMEAIGEANETPVVADPKKEAVSQ